MIKTTIIKKRIRIPESLQSICLLKLLVYGGFTIERTKSRNGRWKWNKDSVRGIYE